MKRTLLTILAGVAVLSSAAWAGGEDPAAALKSINDFRAKMIADAREAKKPIDVGVLTTKTREMAAEAVKGVDPAKIDPKLGLAYAQLYQMAEMPKLACVACERFLSSNPEAAQKYQAQSIMLNSCNELKEGLQVMNLLQEVAPPSALALYGLASSTAFVYADTIRESVSLQAALATIRLIESNVKLSTPANDQEKSRQRSSLASLTEAKAEMLNDAGRKSEALAAIDETINSLGTAAPEARSLNGLKKRMGMLHAAAPALTFERSYGEFKGLDSLKGKVVLLDFFAHWCGPCIASFPDMKQLYADLKPKGLEIIGFTTYYGYYKSENTAKRDMPKDVEFAKMGDFIKDHALPWPVVYGERSNFEAYGVTGIPHVTVIDRAGNVHKIKIGYSKATFAEFRKEIEKLIG